MDLNKFAIGLLGGALLGISVVAYGRIKALEGDNEILRTKWKMHEEELNMAFQLLTEEDKRAVYAKFAANHEFLKTLFPNLDV